MGLINDLATLIGAGMTVEDVKALAEMEKGKKDEQKPIENGTEVPRDEKNGAEEEPHKEGGESEPSKETDASVHTSVEIENLKKELEESKKLIAELQDANRKRNRDDGSIKSDEDLMNDIMLDMY